MEITTEFLKSLVRWSLGAIFGWVVLPLVARNVLTPELAGKIAGSLDHIAAFVTTVIATSVVPLAWSWWNTITAKAKMVIAHEMPPNNPFSEVQAISESLSPKEKLSLATSPGGVPLPKV